MAARLKAALGGGAALSQKQQHKRLRASVICQIAGFDQSLLLLAYCTILCNRTGGAAASLHNVCATCTLPACLPPARLFVPPPDML